MPNNPTLAMRFNQKPVRVYACEEFKDNYKIAITVQSVAPDHVPDSYFYFMGKIVQQTESVRRPESEEGIVIITHEFDEFNTRFNVIEKFIPTSEVLENGFFRTKQDLLNNGDIYRQQKLELDDSRIKLEQIKLKNEEAKQELETTKQQTEELKFKNRSIELQTEGFKVNTEQRRQVFENAKYRDKLQLQKLATDAEEKKYIMDVTMKDLDLTNSLIGSQIKLNSAVFLDRLDQNKLVRKHHYETLSFEQDLLTMQQKATLENNKLTLDQQTNKRKNIEESLKTVQIITSMVKLLF